MSPKDYYGAMVDLVKERRGTDMEVQYIQEKDQVFLTALIPWQEVVCDMNDQVRLSHMNLNMSYIHVAIRS